MADYNIQMSYFNGTSYDNLYPKVSLDNVDGNLSISKIAGILPVANGGTGESNESDALGNLINNSSMAGTLSNSDYLGVFNSSTGRKLSLLSLKNFITNGLSGLNAYHLSSTMQTTGSGSATSDYAYFNFSYSGSYNLAIALSFFSASVGGGSKRTYWSFVWFMTKNSDYAIYCGGEEVNPVRIVDGIFNSNNIQGRIMASNYSRVYVGKKVDLFMF